MLTLLQLGFFVFLIIHVTRRVLFEVSDAFIFHTVIGEPSRHFMNRFYSNRASVSEIITCEISNRNPCIYIACVSHLKNLKYSSPPAFFILIFRQSLGNYFSHVRATTLISLTLALSIPFSPPPVAFSTRYVAYVRSIIESEGARSCAKRIALVVSINADYSL